MKIRTGFVSNSSSSSFVVSFEGLSEDVVARIITWLKHHNDVAEEGYADWGARFAGGSLYHHYPDVEYTSECKETMTLPELLESLGVPEKNFEMLY